MKRTSGTRKKGGNRCDGCGIKKESRKVVKVAGKVGKAQIGETKHNAKQKMKLQCVA